MSEIGVSEAQAIEIGKIGGSKYTLVNTLQLSSAWSNKSIAYVATSRYTIRLYNIENGELLASKALESTGKSEDTEQQSLTDALKSTASSIWSELKNIFKLEAYVKSVTGDNIVLGGLIQRSFRKELYFLLKQEVVPDMCKSQDIAMWTIQFLQNLFVARNLLSMT